MPPILLVLAGLAAYRGTSAAPFIFDDASSIETNASIRHLGALAHVLSPPAGGETVTGRPVVNLTFAGNYALGRLAPAGYHAFNLGIHLLAGLALFGVVRRTLRQRAPAFAIALLWMVHPLQTEAVTYVSQRAESLMGLLLLVTVYGFIRWTERDLHAPEAPPGRLSRPRGRGHWAVLSVVACALGMATKETMVAAPLLILLYDRTFVAGSFRAALRGRAAYYTALAATWVALIACVASSGGRGGTAGFGTGISPWRYALFQATAIVHYLRLSIWPQPLIFDYGTSLAAPAAATASCCVVMVGLLAATGWALVRRPAWGFLGTWFLLLLAPSSSIVPVATQVMAEHRMYLPLAAVIAGSFCAVASIRSSGRRPSSAKPGPRLWPWIWLPLWLPFALIAALLFALRTAARNADYQTARALWERNVADRPSNPRGYIQLALALSHDPALLPEAALQDEAALRLDPNDPVAHNNLGNIYLRLPGRIPDAAAQFREALRLNPISALYHANLAAVLVRREDSAAEAAAQFQRAVQLDPKLVIARNGLGNLLAADPNKSADAIVQFEAVLRLDPDQAQTRNNLAILYARSGRLPEAIRELERVLREHPEMTGAQANLEALRAAAR